MAAYLHDLEMEPWEPPLDRDDVTAIINGVFEANVKLVDKDDVAAIRRLLEDDGEEEEED